MKLALIPVTPFRQNCSLLIDEETNSAAIVDPGGDLDGVLEALTRSELQCAADSAARRRGLRYSTR